MFASTSAMPHMPMPPMPTKWILVSGLRNIVKIERLDTTVYAPRVDMRIIVALALVAACGKSKQQCQADVADLVDYMRSLNVEDSKIGDSSAHLVVRTDGTKKPASYA